MKRIFGLVLLLAGLSGGKLCANDTIRWTWEALEYSKQKNFSFRAVEGGTFVVDWGDGNDTAIVCDDVDDEYVRHEYASAGVYAVRLCATVPNAGIKHFTNTNRLTSLDVSQNVELTRLDCTNNQLTSLDLSKNTALTYLGCGSNKLTSLDVSKNTALTDLFCYSNQLTSLDVSGCIALEQLSCYDNQLVSLKVSDCGALRYLSCSSNQLTSLDVSGCGWLYGLSISDNKLSFQSVADIVSVMPEGMHEYAFIPQHRENRTVETGVGVPLPELPVVKGTQARLGIWRNEELCTDDRYYTMQGGYVHFVEVGNYKVVVSHDSVQDRRWRPVEGGDWQYASVVYGDTTDVVTVYRAYTSGHDAARCTFEMEPSSSQYWTSFAFAGTAGESFIIDWGDGERTIAEGTGELLTFRHTYDSTETLVQWCLYGTRREARIERLEHRTNSRVKKGKFDVSACPELTHLTLCGEHRYVELSGLSHNPKLTYLVCSGNSLSTLDVSKNPVLTYLDCSGNLLSSLDVSGNENLTYLDCSGNFLSVLDVSKNAALAYLNCGSSVLTALDISQNQALMHLECDGNRLSSLDVSKNADLNYLDCHHNRLSSLDVSQNAALKDLNCSCNQLSFLDVSQNVALENLDCYGLQLSSLDVSKNLNLTYLDCSANRLTSLDVSKNVALEGLNCAINYLTSLDISKNVKLDGLGCNDNRLDSLDLSHNVALENLDCTNNYLTSLDMSRNMKLRNLYCANNRLTSLDVSRQPKLNEVYCSSNRLTSLDLSAQTRIDYGNFAENFLGVALDESRSFDVSVLSGMDTNRILSVQGGRLSGTRLFFEADEVTYLYATGYEGEYSKYRDTVSFRLVSDRQADVQIPLTAEFFPDELFRAYVATFDKDGNDSLCRYERAAVKKIDVGGGSETFVYWKRDIQSLEGLQYFENLETLICNANDLTSLDVLRNPALREIYCTHNRLTSLEVVDKPALRYFSCHDNELESLRVIGCPVLEDITCPNNRLTHLEVRDCPVAEWLSCANNQLEKLDISGLPGLEALRCYNNHLSGLDASANPYLWDIYCDHNAIPLSAVAILRTDLRRNGAAVDEMGLSPQRIPVALKVGETLDLRPEMFLEGCVTDIDFGATSESAYTFSDGVVKFNKPGTYKIRLSNEAMWNWTHNWYEGYNYIEDIGVTAEAVEVFYDITVKRGGGSDDPSEPSDPDEPVTPPTDPDDPGVANEGLVSDASAVSVWAYVQGRTIYVTDAVDVNSDEVSVYTTVGQRIYRGHGRAIEVPQAGVYVLMAGERRMKVLVR